MKTGDERATRELWDRYFERLARLAAKRLPREARRDADEEDVALSAFHSFCDCAFHDQFPQLVDRDDLWRLLAVITRRKVIAIARRRSSRKRGGGVVVGESKLLDGPDSEARGMARILGSAPSPEIAVEVAEDFRRLMDALGEGPLRIIARLKTEGHGTGEIAEMLGISTRTVDRKLKLIRDIWENHVAGEA